LDPELVRSAPAAEPAQSGTGRRRIARTDGIAAYLAGLDGDSLRAVIETEAARNDEFRRRLAMQAALWSPSVDVKSLKQVISQATTLRDFLPYRQVPTYVRRTREVVDTLSNMAEGPGAGASIDLIGQLQRAHLAACQRSGPDPTRLAERLFRWELDGDWDVFRGPAETYAGVLGESDLTPENWSTPRLWC